MSRYIKELDDNKTVAYGFDTVTGYFFQLFDESQPEETLLIDEDSFLTGASNADIMSLMIEYGVDENHIAYVGADLPF